MIDELLVVAERGM